MHEVGLMQTAIQMAEEQARASGARQIHTLRLRVGRMSGVVPEALEFAFDIVARGTLAEGARLEIESTPALCWCAACAAVFETDDLSFQCPHCGTFSTELRGGTEMQLSSIEVS